MRVTQIWIARTLSLLRIAAALFLMQHGTSKFLAFPSAVNAAPFSAPWFAGIFELFGGALLLVGFLSRQVAFLLSGMTAVAYFMVHAPQGFYPVLNHGELAALYAFVFLYLSLAGPGPWSIDELLERRRLSKGRSTHI